MRSILGLALCSVCLITACADAQPITAPTTMSIGRPDNRVRFCGFGGDGSMLDMLGPYWPNLEYCRAFDDQRISSMADLGRDAKQRGVVYSVQSAAPVFPAGYLEAHDCWAIDFLNRKPAELGMGHPVSDYCHPATLAALKDNLKVAFTQGNASAFMMVDFVWPWVGGSWGYSKADFAAYRAALAGTDGGLQINGRDGNQTLSFADYLYELSGLRLTPGDLGYQHWDEYEPVRPNQVGAHPTEAQLRNAFVFRGLFHYCWLRYAQQAGVAARALGGELQASLNPENMANGTDLLTWGRLSATGEPFMEEWGNAAVVVAGYHDYRYFTEPYLAHTKRLGLIGETGAAGGHPDSGFGPARPHYWDPNSNYAITWALSAAGQFDDREEDYMYASPQETLDPAGPQADCWRGYVKAMDGFWQYALDKPRRAIAPVLSIVNRSILLNSESSEQSTHQKYSLAPALDDLHIDFEQGYFPLSDSMLAGRKILLFAPWEYPREMLPRLAQWLAQDKSRVLVTHSFVPTRPCKGLIVDAVPELDDTSAANVLGLTGLHQTSVLSGTISAIDPSWTGAFSLPVGTAIKLDRPLVACEGKPLVKLGDAALVTAVQTSGGGNVIYLNFSPPEHSETAGHDTDRLLRAVMQAVMRNNQIAPIADGAPDWACCRFDLPAGNAFLLLNRAQLSQSRFTEETPSYDPAGKLALNLKPQTAYWIYDVLGETLGMRSSDDAGHLEIFLSGRSIRLLYMVPISSEPRLLFCTCERRDTRARNDLPAKLFAHRAGKAVLAGLRPGEQVMLDGKPAALLDTSIASGKVLMVPQGEHSIEIRPQP